VVLIARMMSRVEVEDEVEVKSNNNASRFACGHGHVLASWSAVLPRNLTLCAAASWSRAKLLALVSPWMQVEPPDVSA